MRPVQKSIRKMEKRQNLKRYSHGIFGSIAKALLALALATSVSAQSPGVPPQVVLNKSDYGSTKSEGLFLEAQPIYVEFTGDDRLLLEVSLPKSINFDYTVMFWFRSRVGYDELKAQTDNILDKKLQLYLFELPGGASCYISRLPKGTSGDVSKDHTYLYLRCTPGNENFSINLSELPDIQSWMHLTYSANYQPTSKSSAVKSTSYVRIDISTFNIIAYGDYVTLNNNNVSYGGALNNSVNKGFPGDYRQFYITLGYIQPENIQYLMHQQKVLDFSTLGYYKFERTKLLDRFDDAFRNQRAITSKIPPKFVAESIAVPFCNSIPQQFYLLPQFYKSAVDAFSGIEIPKFKFKGRKIGYTLSFWMQNYGGHTFSRSPLEGRTKNHLIKLDDSFAIWYDSKTSFRVYVYAKDNWMETFSDPVFLPLNEWINIQLTIEQSSGITVMTFNQNGDRQQLVTKKVTLAEQYPKGTLTLFQSFIGVPFQLQIWQTYIQLPIDGTNPKFYEDDKIVSHNFSKSNYTKRSSSTDPEGWVTLLANGAKIPAKEGEGFDFIYKNAPTNVNYVDKSTVGTLQANSTQWNVTCPSPAKSQMYLSGQGAKVTMDVLVNKTESYTVEFWFKSDVINAKNLQCNINTTKSTKPLTCTTNNPGDNNNGLNATITGKDKVLLCKNDKKPCTLEQAMSPLFCENVDRKNLTELYCSTTTLKAGSKQNITSTVMGYYTNPKTNTTETYTCKADSIKSKITYVHEYSPTEIVKDGPTNITKYSVEKCQENSVVALDEDIFCKTKRDNPKIACQNQTYLFMMAGNSEDTKGSNKAGTAMEIFVDNGVLKCAPFGRKNTEYILIYDNIDVLNEQRWQHISCTYMKQRFVKGQYLAIDLDLNNTNFRSDYYRAKNFAKSIYTEKKALQFENELRDYRWNVILGNNSTLGYYFYGYFKDVRVWSSSRKDEEILSYRFQQVKAQENLAGNLKFMDGTPYIKNSAENNVNGVQFAGTEPTMVLEQSDGKNIICSTDTYFELKEQVCKRFPYLHNVEIIYYVENDVQHGHLMVLEQIANTASFLPGEWQPQLRIVWDFNNTEIESKYIKNKTETPLRFDPIFMGDFKRYNFTIKISDMKDHNFFLQMQKYVVPMKCNRVVDVLTDSSKSEASYIIDLQNKQPDICFNFMVKKIEGCTDEYASEVQETVGIVSSPSGNSSTQLFQQKFNKANSSFQVCIPDEISKANLRTNLPIDVIFFVNWFSKTAPDDAKQSYMNMAYKLTLIKNITVQLDYWTDTAAFGDVAKTSDFPVIDLNDPNQRLRISASRSRFTDGTTGLSFQWECEGELQEYCNQWKGSSEIEFNNTMISKDLKLTNIPTKIVVVVFAFEAIGSPDVKKLFFRSSDMKFTWSNTAVPKFEIRLPKDTKRPGTDNWLLISSEQTIEVAPQSFKVDDPGFKYDFKVEKIYQCNATYFENNTWIFQSRDPKKGNVTCTKTNTTVPLEDSSKSWITFKNNTLEPNSTYTVTVTVRNEIVTAIKPIVKSVNFSTGQLPTKGAMTIQPSNGTSYETDFTITFSNYDTSAQLNYTLFGTNEYAADELKLQESVSLNQIGKTTVIKKLPTIKNMKAKIKDEITGEEVYISKNVEVERNKKKNWTQVLTDETLKNQPSFQKWQYFNFIAAQANQPTPSKLSEAETNDIIEVDKEIATTAFEDIQKLQFNTVDKSDERLITAMVSTIQDITTQSQFIDPKLTKLEDSTLQTCVSTIEKILRFEGMLQQLFSSKSFRDDFVGAVGNLLQLTAQRANFYSVLENKQSAAGNQTAELVYRIPKNIDWTSSQAEIATQKLLRRALQANVNSATTTAAADGQTVEKVNSTQVNGAANETISRRDLLDFISGTRGLIEKLIVIKNNQLDLFCKSGYLSTKNNDFKIISADENLEFYVKKIMKDDKLAKEYTTISNDSNKVSVALSLDTVLQKSLSSVDPDQAAEIDKNFSWVCLQVSFMKSNPVAGSAVNLHNQYYFKDQYYVQISSIDNLERRIGSNLELEDVPFQINFNQALTKEAQFYPGQTICAHFDGNQQTDGQFWTNVDSKNQTDCSYIYAEDSKPQQLVCKCSSLKNFYYTVITDQNKKAENQDVNQDVSHVIMTALIIPLCFLGLFGPCFMVALDAHDYQQVEDNIYAVTEATALILQKVRNRQCIQEIYYNEKEFERYQQLREFKYGSNTAFATYLRTLHNYFSLFSHFDFRLKRVSRFTIVLGQISLITLCLWLCYSKDFERLAPNLVSLRFSYLPIVLGFLTLPPPRKLLFFLKTEMYFMRKNNPEDKRDVPENEKAPLVKEQDTQADEDGNEEKKKIRPLEPVDWTIDRRPVLIDKYIYFKLIFIVYIFLFWIFTIVVTVLLTQYAGQSDEPEWYKTYVELSPEQAQEVVICWYLAIFFWGTLINVLRCFIISLAAPRKAKELFDKYQAIYIKYNQKYADLPNYIEIQTKKNEEERKINRKIKKIDEQKITRDKKLDYDAELKADLANFNGFFTQCSCLTFALLPYEAVEIGLDALFTIDIIANKKKYNNFEYLAQEAKYLQKLKDIEIYGEEGEAKKEEKKDADSKKLEAGLENNQTSRLKSKSNKTQSKVNQSNTNIEKSGPGGKSQRSKGSKETGKNTKRSKR